VPITKPQKELLPPQTRTDKEWGIQTKLDSKEETIIKAIRQGTAIAESARSFQNQEGMAAWTIESKTKAHRIVGRGRTPGLAMDQSAYQSKLFGLWGIVYTLTKLTNKHKLHNGKIMVACVGLSALQQAQHDNPTNPTLAHYDIIGAIQTLKRKLWVQLHLEHFHGHQNASVMMVLTQQAWMNIEMDKLAKQTINYEVAQPTRYRIPGNHGAAM